MRAREVDVVRRRIRLDRRNSSGKQSLARRAFSLAFQGVFRPPFAPAFAQNSYRVLSRVRHRSFSSSPCPFLYTELCVRSLSHSLIFSRFLLPVLGSFIKWHLLSLALPFSPSLFYQFKDLCRLELFSEGREGNNFNFERDILSGMIRKLLAPRLWNFTPGSRNMGSWD